MHINNYSRTLLKEEHSEDQSQGQLLRVQELYSLKCPLSCPPR